MPHFSVGGCGACVFYSRHLNKCVFCEAGHAFMFGHDATWIVPGTWVDD